MSYTYDEDAKMVDFRDTEEKMRDFFREGSNSLAYQEVLRRISDDDQILEDLFKLGQIDYTSPYVMRTADTTATAFRIQNAVQDIVEEMIKEGEI